ncbi:MAG: sigma-54-dependent Fis family transcriptional regulator [Deltaproteobacteria bacterium]|nr:sigma-54-dependent Fis family transcriptional regulator [Deltaproteobacteria bacterium]
MTKEKFKILITDDDSDLRELLIEAVRNWGYDADVAKEGEEALRKLRMVRYDIVVCDLMMPGMDGITLLRKVKELDKDILVIIITGYATIETAVTAIEAGAYDYIAKPFRLDELMIVIKNACERLRLIFQNKALLDELRGAYAELSSLKKALGVPVDRPSTGDEAAGPGDRPGDYSERDANPAKQQEYVKEADRFLRLKTSAKP